MYKRIFSIVFILVFTILLMQKKQLSMFFTTLSDQLSEATYNKVIKSDPLQELEAKINLPIENNDSFVNVSNEFSLKGEKRLTLLKDFSLHDWNRKDFDKTLDLFLRYNEAAFPNKAITRDEFYTSLINSLTSTKLSKRVTRLQKMTEDFTPPKDKMFSIIYKKYTHPLYSFTYPNDYLTMLEFSRLTENIIKQYVKSEPDKNILLLNDEFEVDSLKNHGSNLEDEVDSTALPIKNLYSDKLLVSSKKEIRLQGHVKKIYVFASNANLIIENGSSIDKIILAESAVGATISIEDGAVVHTIVAKADQGKVVSNGELIRVKRAYDSFQVKSSKAKILDLQIESVEDVDYNNAEKPFFSTEYTLLEDGIHVLAADDDYLWAAGNGRKSLKRSDDFGDSWEEVYRFSQKIEAFHITPNDILLVSLSDGRWLSPANSKIVRSDDGGTTFTHVLDVKSGAAYNWNIASDAEGYIFVSEYGYKKLPDNARRIYRSSDNGLTWEIVYEPNETEGYHNHVISIDKNDNQVIRQVIGDDVKVILESKDRGDTWKEIVSGYHPTSVLQFGDDILWGLDGAPTSGIIRYDSMTNELSYAFETPEPLKGSIYDMLYADGIIYAGLLSYSGSSNDWDGSIFISKDRGYTWEKFAQWPKYTDETGIGFYKFTKQGEYGFIHSQIPIMRNGVLQSYHGTLRFELR